VKTTFTSVRPTLAKTAGPVSTMLMIPLNAHARRATTKTPVELKY